MQAAQPASRVTALIAEDETMLRAQLRKRLEHAWPELEIVGEAENGEQAIALCERLEPDIAFLDIRMPVKSGLEVAAVIGGDCHVVFVTAYDEYAVTAFEQGAIDYLLKPVEAERLALTVERLKQQLGKPAPDLGTVIDQLAQASGVAGGSQLPRLRWIKASIGANIRLISVQEIAYFQ
jgi:DNA-binding LytR/AlgR family response regulator